MAKYKAIIHYRPINHRLSRLVDIARNLKKTYQSGRVFVVCFALKNGNQIITVGTNSYEKVYACSEFGPYKPFKADYTNTYVPTVHAEIACLKNLGSWRRDFSDIELFIVRLDNQPEMNVKESCPCINCQRVLSGYKFKKILFSAEDPNLIGQIKLKR